MVFIIPYWTQITNDVKYELFDSMSRPYGKPSGTLNISRCREIYYDMLWPNIEIVDQYRDQDLIAYIEKTQPPGYFNLCIV
jgi:hypothetical protein